MLLNIVYDDASDFRFKSDEHAAHQIMSKRPFLLHSIESHGNGVADAVIDVNYVGFVVVSKENGAAIDSGHDAFDGN